MNYTRTIPRVDIRRRKDETPVKEGLAVTPSEMYKMAQEGIAVSTSNLPDNNWNDGTTEQGTSIAPYERRFNSEPTDLWELSRNAKKKIGKAIQYDKDMRAYEQRTSQATQQNHSSE